MDVSSSPPPFLSFHFSELLCSKFCQFFHRANYKVISSWWNLNFLKHADNWLELCVVNEAFLSISYLAVTTNNCMFWAGRNLKYKKKRKKLETVKLLIRLLWFIKPKDHIGHKPRFKLPLVTDGIIFKPGFDLHNIWGPNIKLFINIINKL